MQYHNFLVTIKQATPGMATQPSDGDDPPIAAPSIMDDIPLEIAAMIMENLLEYDLAPTPNSEFLGSYWRMVRGQLSSTLDCLAASCTTRQPRLSLPFLETAHSDSPKLARTTCAALVKMLSSAPT
jgi:hypothetical protein